MTAKVTVYGFWRLIIELLSLLLNAVADNNELYHIPILQNEEAKNAIVSQCNPRSVAYEKVLDDKNFRQVQPTWNPILLKI